MNEALPDLLTAGKNLDASLELLRTIGAIDNQDRITNIGRSIAEIPMHPRLAAIVITGRKENVQEQALLAACLISEEMIIDFRENAFETTTCDVTYQGNLMRCLAQNKDLDSKIRKKYRSKETRSSTTTLQKFSK